MSWSVSFSVVWQGALWTATDYERVFLDLQKPKHTHSNIAINMLLYLTLTSDLYHHSPVAWEVRRMSVYETDDCVLNPAQPLIKSCFIVYEPSSWKSNSDNFAIKNLHFNIYILCPSRFSPIYDFRRHARSYCSPSQKPRPPFKDTVYYSTKVWPPDIFPMRCIWNLTRPHVISLPITAHVTHQATAQIVTFSGFSVNIHRNKSTLNLLTWSQQIPVGTCFYHIQRTTWCQQRTPHTNVLATYLEMLQINESGK